MLYLHQRPNPRMCALSPCEIWHQHSLTAVTVILWTWSKGGIVGWSVNSIGKAQTNRKNEEFGKHAEKEKERQNKKEINKNWDIWLVVYWHGRRRRRRRLERSVPMKYDKFVFLSLLRFDRRRPLAKEKKTKKGKHAYINRHTDISNVIFELDVDV